MFVTTTFNIERCNIAEYKGIVRGIVVRAPTIAQGIGTAVLILKT